jgi:hypothetical protein
MGRTINVAARHPDAREHAQTRAGGEKVDTR